MKNVVLVSPPPNIIVVDRASTDKYYGVQIHAGERGFVTRSEYYDGKFVLRCLSGFTRGNGWDSWDRDTLIEHLTALLDAGKRVSEFDTPEELMAWAMEK